MATGDGIPNGAIPSPGSLAGLRGRQDAPSFWTGTLAAIADRVGCAPAGLTSQEAAERLSRFGPNLASPPARRRLVLRIARKLAEPLVAILLAAALVSAIAGDWASFATIAVVVLLSVTLESVQEHSAEASVAALQGSVAIVATILRDGSPVGVPIDRIVPGDIALLRAGDLVPADGVILSSTSARADEALLTGEPYPVDKESAREDGSPLTDLNALFAGTALVSGEAKLWVVATGAGTRLGRIAAELRSAGSPGALERGLHRLGIVVLRLTIFLLLFVLLSQLALHRPPLESFLFAVAIAVGITPELLPMVMTVTLARGAVRMAGRKVIVRSLPAIHDLGAMDTLCTDKTGTLTKAEVELAETVTSSGARSELVAELARVNSRFSTGLTTPLDAAILAGGGDGDLQQWTRIADAPFDFERRRSAVLAETLGERLVVIKGAPEHVLPLCPALGLPDGPTGAMDDRMRERVGALCQAHAEQGFRLLAVAWKRAPGRTTIGPEDESDLALAGFCLFRDPPKASATAAIARLRGKGVAVKIISGDDPRVVRHLIGELGLPARGVLTGEDIGRLTDTQLAHRAPHADLYARVSPEQKSRIVRALRARGHVVGFLGDGINDAPAIRAADVGLSVAEGSNVAREAADIILLNQDLGVVADGVEEGRRTFSNIMKYVRAGASSNLGNMVSMSAAPLLLPFLPLLPIQVLINNLIYDVSELGIPFDTVEPEEMAEPHNWDIRGVLRFALVMGLLSSFFDMATFGLLLWVFEAEPETFRTAWFVESMATQILVVFVIRTNGPSLKGRPHPALLASSLLALGCALLLASEIGAPLGFIALPGTIWGCIIALTVAYLAAAEFGKRMAASPRPAPTRRHTSHGKAPDGGE